MSGSSRKLKDESQLLVAGIHQTWFSLSDEFVRISPTGNLLPLAEEFSNFCASEEAKNLYEELATVT